MTSFKANPNRTENYNYKRSKRLYFDENRVLPPNRRKKYKKQNTMATLNNYCYVLSNYLVSDTFWMRTRACSKMRGVVLVTRMALSTTTFAAHKPFCDATSDRMMPNTIREGSMPKEWPCNNKPLRRDGISHTHCKRRHAFLACISMKKASATLSLALPHQSCQYKRLIVG